MQDRILIVDDDDFVLACFQRLLAPRYQTETASGPDAALEAIRVRGPYAVVLSDLQMPGMNGIEMIEKAKKLSPDTVGVVLSGNTAPSEIQSDAVYRVLDKPCSTADLNAAVADAVTHHYRLRRRE
jgi:DNA-binding NtrC family response regulator